MKKIFKNFYKKNKKIIWLLGISTISFFLILSLMALFIRSKPEAILDFLQTSEIKREILPFTILSFMGMCLGLVFIILIIIAVIKMIFPNTKAFSSLFMKDEADFLLSLPKKIKKGVIDNGK
ncbi:hypothetical protein [Senegalia sp. (in: firmicutes)]|uniref:hypothetical protein n=1 Tax=Senegalia sp. (in: firmicutes) TaxID=1924098 RepID=UPI003F99CBD0